MPDEERLIAAIMDLANQVARVAWALETARIDTPDLVDGSAVYEQDPCSKCGSQLVMVDEPNCPACLEPKKEDSDAGHREPTL